MSRPSHSQIWTAIDQLAARFDMTTSALAKVAGLDPTSFNRSKRFSPDPDVRPRWPSTESLSKVLAATGVTFSEFAAMAEGGGTAGAKGVPLIGFAQAGDDGYFDDAGFPVGQGWDEIDFPGLDREGVYALEISGDSMTPVYREGDRIVVDPTGGEDFELLVAIAPGAPAPGGFTRVGTVLPAAEGLTFRAPDGTPREVR